jgi:hypothetical protein
MTRTCSRLLMVSGGQNNLLSEPNSLDTTSTEEIASPSKKILAALQVETRLVLTWDSLRTRICSRATQGKENGESRSEQSHLYPPYQGGA